MAAGLPSRVSADLHKCRRNNALIHLRREASFYGVQVIGNQHNRDQLKGIVSCDSRVVAHTLVPAGIAGQDRTSKFCDDRGEGCWAAVVLGVIDQLNGVFEVVGCAKP